MKQVDSITIEVIRGLLVSTVAQMRATLIRTAYSPILYDTHDFSCGLMSAKGELIGMSEDFSIHVFPMALTMGTILHEFGHAIYPGDVFMVNDPYQGGTHLNDVAFCAPFFFDGKLMAFSMVRAHWADIGGTAVGISGKATEILEEGIRIPCVKVKEKGQTNQALLKVLFANIRFPEEREGDTLAMLDTIRVAEMRLSEVCAKYGTQVVDECINAILDRAEQAMRQRISQLPDGEYWDEVYCDNSGLSTVPLLIKVGLKIKGDTMTIDFTGTAPSVEGPTNSGPSAGPTAGFTAVKTWLEPKTPVNGGSFRPINFIVPEGTILNAKYPRPCAAGPSLGRIALNGVAAIFARLMPQEAAGQFLAAANHTVIAGYDQIRGRPFMLYEYPRGGTLATTTNDGNNACFDYDVGDIPSVYPAESLEQMLPLLVESIELRTDSGGPGYRRGGCGIRRRIRVLSQTATFSELTNAVVIPPGGANGGYSGTRNAFTVLRDNVEIQPCDIPGKARNFPLKRGDVVVMESGSGGGVGDPLTREVELLKQDVVEGYVSPRHAREKYGVVVVDGEVDLAQTEELRRQLREQRHRVKVISSPTDHFDKNGCRLCVMSKEVAEMIGVRDGDLVEYVSKGSTPLRAWVKVSGSLPVDGILVGPIGRGIIEAEEGDSVEIRAV